MKKIRKITSIICVLTVVLTLSGIVIPVEEVHAQDVSVVKVDPNIQFQTLEGWGINLAWWGNTIGNWPEDKRDEIGELLFGDNGLDMNIVRFNIGAGDNPTHDHMNSGCFLNAEMEGYEPEEGVWNWNGDEGQRNMLQIAKNKGVNIFEAFANSAPYWMTKSGCTAGNVLSLPNFKPEYTDAFAEYLVQVVKHARDYWGIDFRSLEPFNEPDGFWMKGRPQEGMIIWDTQNDILKSLHDKIEENGLNTQLTAMDVWSIDKLDDHYDYYEDITKSYLCQLNVHSYSGDNRRGVNAFVEQEGKRLWMSEFGCGEGNEHNNIENGTKLAEIIINDLREMKPDAWLYWQPVENEEDRDDAWGFIHANYKDTSYKYWIKKQYYTYGQFSKFIKAGYKLIDIGSKDAIGAYDEDSKKLVILMLNNTDSDINYNYDLSRFNSMDEYAVVYRTSSQENLAHIEDASISNKQLTAIAKAKSITTYVVSNIDYIPLGQVKEIDNNIVGTDINEFNYVGNWNYENGNHISDVGDSYAEFAFEGTGVKLYGNKGIDYGMVGVSVDDGAEIWIDLFSEVSKEDTYIFSSKRLAAGTHKIKVRVTGDKNPFSQGCGVGINCARGIDYRGEQINISKTDDREITDVKLGIDFYIDGKKHYDYEYLDTFDNTKQTYLKANGGNNALTHWAGDFLKLNSSKNGPAVIEITNLDDRDIENVTVHIDFKIDGTWHYDYEDISNLDGIINLTLDAHNGSFNIIKNRYEGDYLK